MKKLSKKLLTVLLALALVISVVAVGVLADEEDTTTVEVGTPEQLTEALAESDVKEIKLTADITLTEQVEIKKEITLDLGGFSLTKDADVAENTSIIKTGASGDLTIKGAGEITGVGALLLANGGELTVESGVSVSQTAKENPEESYTANHTAVAASGTAGKLTFKGSIDAAEYGIGVFDTGSVIVEDAFIVAQGFGITTNGSGTDATASIEIKGESVIIGGEDSCAIYLPNGKLTVGGSGHIFGGAGIVVRGGLLTVTEDYTGFITATSQTDITVGDATSDGSKYAVPPAAVVLDQNDAYTTSSPTETPQVTLEGGNFEAQTEKAAVACTKNGKNDTDADNKTFDVKGGVFNSAVDEDLLDDTIKARLETSTGKFSYYTSKADANAAKGPDDEVNLVTAAENDPSPETYAVSGTEATITINVPSDTQVTIKVYKGTDELDDDNCVDDLTKNDLALIAGNNPVPLDLSSLSGGLYTVVVSDNDTPTTVYGIIHLTLYKITYTLSTGVTGSESVFYTDSETELEARKHMAPGSITLAPEVNKWTFGSQNTDDYNVNVTVGGEYSSPIDPGHTCPTKKFKDMAITDTSKLWCHVAMDYMVLNGYINGFPGDILQPYGIATRAQMLVIMAQTKTVPVAGNPWYKAAVDWAKKNDYSDGDRPDDPIQREEIVTILWKIAGQPKADTKGLEKFPDAANVNTWAKTAMAWAVEKGIMHGRVNEKTGVTELIPQGCATRAELSVFIYNYITMMK